MANSRLTKQDAAQTIKALKAAGGVAAEAARQLKIPINTFKGRVDAAVGRFGFERSAVSKIERVKLVEPATPAHLRKIAQLEQTVKDLRGQLGEMTKEQVSAHALREIIHGCADVPAKPPAWRFKQASGHTTGIPLLFASDWHWDEVVDPAQIGGVNAYNHRRGPVETLLWDVHRPHHESPLQTEIRLRGVGAGRGYAQREYPPCPLYRVLPGRLVSSGRYRFL